MTQAAPVCGTAHGQPWNDATRAQSVSDRRRVVAAVPDDAMSPTPPPSAGPLQRRNGVHERQRLLRVVAVRSCQLDGERHAARVTNQMMLAASLGTIGGIRTSLRAAVHGTHGTTVDDRAGPIDEPPRASQSSNAK